MGWVKACIIHFHWAVQSTKQGLRHVILAKFHSFLTHVRDIHEDSNNKLFNKCAHGPIHHERTWLSTSRLSDNVVSVKIVTLVKLSCLCYADSVAFEKFDETLNKKALTRAVMNFSPLDQTSCLEAYHSVVNQFAPKMLHFSYLGMYCRYVLL